MHVLSVTTLQNVAHKRKNRREGRAREREKREKKSVCIEVGWGVRLGNGRETEEIGGGNDH